MTLEALLAYAHFLAILTLVAKAKLERRVSSTAPTFDSPTTEGPR